MQQYEKFRYKWDNMKPRSSDEAAMLAKAKHYYYSTYAPCRSYKWAAVATGTFFRTGKVEHLRWGWQLFKAGVASWAKVAQ